MTTRLLALPLLLLTAAPAFAHAFLDHASPAVGGTVPASPPVLRLWFTEGLEPAFSTVAVTDAAGADVEAGAAAVDAKDGSLLEVPLKKLPAGTYTVKWRVVSVDTHTTDGSFTFSVGGP
jgi:copper resistance protein C